MNGTILEDILIGNLGNLDTSKQKIRNQIDEYIIETIKKNPEDELSLESMASYCDFMHSKTDDVKYSSLKDGLGKTVSDIKKDAFNRCILDSYIHEFEQQNNVKKSKNKISFNLKGISGLFKGKNQSSYAKPASKKSKKFIKKLLLYTSPLWSPFVAAGIFYGSLAIKPINQHITSKIPYIDNIAYNYNLVKEGVDDISKRISFTTTKVLSEDGKVIGEYFSDKRDPVESIDDIPKPIIDAVCAMEDKRFYNNKLFDPKIFCYDIAGIIKAGFSNLFKKQGENLSGGSTIEMQTVEATRNGIIEMENGNIKKTDKWSIKIAELVSAFDIYKFSKKGKDEIMKRYLNEIYFGQKSYGIKVAVETYLDMGLDEFKELPMKKQIAYSAMFAALPKSPVKYDPIRFFENNEKRAGFALRNLAKANPDLKVIVNEIYDFKSFKWNINLDELVEKAVLNKRTSFPSDFAIDIIEDIDPKNFDKGYTVITTIDSKIQKKLEDIINKKTYNLTISTKMPIEGAGIVIHSKTGAIKALVGGSWSGYEPRGLNRAKRGFQVGSLAKVPTFLLALRSGYNKNSQIADVRYNFSGYSPQNYDGNYEGLVTLNYALAHSLNTIGVKLFSEMTNKYGFGGYRKFLKGLGVNAEIKQELGEGLGSWNSTLLEMACMFNVINNKGRYIEPHIIKSTEDIDGEDSVYSYSPKQVVKPSVAKDMKSILEHVVKTGTGRIVGKGGGKTGTTDECRASWYVGIFGEYTVGAVVINDDNLPMYRRDNSNNQHPIYKNTNDKSRIVYVGDTVTINKTQYYKMFNDTAFTEPVMDSLGNQIIRSEGRTPNDDKFYLIPAGIIKDTLSDFDSITLNPDNLDTSLRLDQISLPKDTLTEIKGIRALGIYGSNAGTIVRDMFRFLDK